MPLRIYNSLTRCKVEFHPQHPEQITMYVCGVTVYDYCHLGHARAYVVWDMVRRYLQYRFGATHRVHYVQNITDIDDKILKRANELGITMQELAETYIKACAEDMAKLNILPADRYPRATEYVPAMIRFIQELEAQGYAYASGGDVYYAVQKFPEYGKLSHRQLSNMQAGASGRVEEGEQKRYPLDFALWKAAKPKEPYWESPWGRGRPGWHIECSAMVKECLGDTIDIHAGGADLQFPHHENEIAQSEAVTKKPLARFWMHNGFVNINGEKMSKSLGNFKTLRSLLAVYEPMAIRLFILQSHYRQPIDFTEEAIAASTKAWHTIEEAIASWNGKLPEQGEKDNSYVEKFTEAMDDDFNTAVALSVIFELSKKLIGLRNSYLHSGKYPISEAELSRLWHTLKFLAGILGLETDKVLPSSTGENGTELERKGDAQTDMAKVVEELIKQRKLARKAKNYRESDRIRDELKTMGVTLVDQPDGTTRWWFNA
jgi:cysteinyl-tRNA synthetase